MVLLEPLGGARSRGRAILWTLALSFAAHGGAVFWVAPPDAPAGPRGAIDVVLVGAAPAPAAVASEPPTALSEPEEPDPEAAIVPGPVARVQAEPEAAAEPPASGPASPKPIHLVAAQPEVAAESLPEREPPPDPVHTVEASPEPAPTPPPPEPTRRVEAQPQPVPKRPAQIESPPAQPAIPEPPPQAEGSSQAPTSAESTALALLETRTRPDPGVAARAKERYLAQVQGWVERHKRYPPVAQRLRQQGTALLRFTLDRDGTVLDYRIERSTGHPALDAAVAKLVADAAPFPAIPAEVASAQIQLVLPVAYRLSGG